MFHGIEGENVLKDFSFLIRFTCKVISYILFENVPGWGLGIGFFFCNIFCDFVFATLLIRQNVCNIGFCNIYFLAKKFATLCFATCQKNAKFHATFFCNKNVAKIRFCNICVDFGNVLKNKVISSGVKNCY